MRAALFNPLDSVLLVGEGNFSFSVELLSLHLPIKITSTCLESTLSEQQKRNTLRLVDAGVEVFTGIDGTKLHENPFLMNERFNKIIFNFPHVGGKMKIHLNRLLLRNFFRSASQLLVKPSGCIIVSLCGGQGADYVGKRCWGDSWQVVEMAGQSDLLLTECSSFQRDLFPLYTNVGYRSLDKSFHTDNAVVHVFRHISPPFCDDVDVDSLLQKTKISSNYTCSPVFANKLKQNILHNSSSAPSYCLSRFFNKMGSFLKTCLADEDLMPLIVNDDLRPSLLPAVNCLFTNWKQDEFDAILCAGLAFNKLGVDFQKSPVTVQALLISKEEQNLSQVISEMLFECKVQDVKIRETKYTVDLGRDMHIMRQLSFCSQEKQQNFVVVDVFRLSKFNRGYTVALLNLDHLTCTLLRLSSWRQMWATTGFVEVDQGIPFLRNICPYPVQYCFDISFIVNETYSEEKMLNILWDIGGDLIVSIQHVSEFTSPFKSWHSQCYRLTYMSYDKPLCRERALAIHQNFIGGALSLSLGVAIQ